MTQLSVVPTIIGYALLLALLADVMLRAKINAKVKAWIIRLARQKTGWAITLSILSLTGWDLMFLAILIAVVSFLKYNPLLIIGIFGARLILAYLVEGYEYEETRKRLGVTSGDELIRVVLDSVLTSGEKYEVFKSGEDGNKCIENLNLINKCRAIRGPFNMFRNIILNAVLPCTRKRCLVLEAYTYCFCPGPLFLVDKIEALAPRILVLILLILMAIPFSLNISEVLPFAP